ncbi:hypothetical protein F5Y13DRAFT_189793 [Hypoxylon sp. FL1857]|nr:hypothetical protein F5Y13DRAFT_189793 [Hypoxylon sp. FL1857]
MDLRNPSRQSLHPGHSGSDDQHTPTPQPTNGFVGQLMLLPSQSSSSSTSTERSDFTMNACEEGETSDMVQQHLIPCCDICVEQRVQLVGDILHDFEYELEGLLARFSSKEDELVEELGWSRDNAHYVNYFTDQGMYYDHFHENTRTKFEDLYGPYMGEEMIPTSNPTSATGWTIQIPEASESTESSHRITPRRRSRSSLVHVPPPKLFLRQIIWDDTRGPEAETLPNCEPYVFRLPLSDLKWDECIRGVIDVVENKYPPLLRVSVRPGEGHCPGGNEMVLGFAKCHDRCDRVALYYLNHLFDALMSYYGALLIERRSIDFAHYFLRQCEYVLKDRKVRDERKDYMARIKEGFVVEGQRIAAVEAIVTPLIEQQPTDRGAIKERILEWIDAPQTHGLLKDLDQRQLLRLARDVWLDLTHRDESNGEGTRFYIEACLHLEIRHGWLFEMLSRRQSGRRIL